LTSVTTAGANQTLSTLYNELAPKSISNHLKKIWPADRRPARLLDPELHKMHAQNNTNSRIVVYLIASNAFQGGSRPATKIVSLASFTVQPVPGPALTFYIPSGDGPGSRRTILSVKVGVCGIVTLCIIGGTEITAGDIPQTEVTW